MKREEIFRYVKEQYGTEPEYLWKKDPDSAVLRHKSGKWYAIIMAVEKKTLGLEEDGKIDILDMYKWIFATGYFPNLVHSVALGEYESLLFVPL